ncbi:MAG: calcium/sodium antiporter [Acidobacteria bacterium]|nr:calcium/sodium antiporter [Acidobacteriota bacterium]
MAWLVFIGGLAVLLVGAELFVRGSSRLAAAFGVPALVIGLTVVAFGTSAPEAAVSVRSVLAGQSDIGLGNIIGSNIANVLLILGLASVISPLPVSARVVRVDVPVMIGFSVLLWLLCFDGSLGRADGLLLLLLLVVYNVWLVTAARRDAARSGQSRLPAGKPSSSIVFIVLGFVGIVLGAGWLVKGAVSLAQTFGLSELVIGLTVVAVGTSMPEIATSILAGLRGEQDIAVGNAVGSNVFNILMVVGLAASLSPRAIQVHAAALTYDLPIMIIVAVACLPIFFIRYRIGRWEGLVFLFYYGAYTAHLILRAKEHEAMAGLSLAMTHFVVPLTLTTVGVCVYRSWRRRRVH